MATKSWHNNRERGIEVERGLARTGSPKRLDPLRIHPGMASRTSTTLGAPPTGASPDASSPLPTDPETQHGSKKFAVPAVNPGTPSKPQRGTYNPALADAVTGEAHRGPADFAPDLHTLPAQTTEE